MILVHGHARVVLESCLVPAGPMLCFPILTCGFWKTIGTLLGVLGCIELASRACRGFFGPLVPTSAASSWAGTTVAKQSTWHSDSSTSQPQRLRGLSLTTKARSETLQHRRIAPDSADLLAYLLASFLHGQRRRTTRAQSGLMESNSELARL